MNIPPSRTVGLIIEGVNADTYAGIVWYYGEKPDGVQASYLWIRALTSVPKAIAEDCTPITGQIRSSLGDFQITRTADAVRYLTGRDRRTTIAMAADYTPGDVTIELNTTGLSTGMIWVDDECLNLGAEGSPGVYNIVPQMAETDGQIHVAGTLVWRKNWYLWRRRFRLIEYDWDDGTTRTIARGSVDALRGGGNKVMTLSTSSLPSLISGGTINKGARRYRATGRAIAARGDWLGTADLLSRVHRDPATPGTISSLQAGGTVSQGTPITGDGRLWGVFASGPRFMPFTCPVIESEDGIIDDKEARELFVVTPVEARSSSRGLSTDLPGAWRHRIALAYGFLRSGRGPVDGDWDRWTGVWGMGLRFSDFDQPAILTRIKETAPDVDQLVLGWDGEPVPIEPLICSTLLLPGGYHLATKENGQIYFASYRLPNIDDLANAPVVLAIPQTLEEDMVIEDQATSVVAEIGGTPWADPDLLSIDIVTGQRTDTTRSAAYESASQFPIDFQTIARTREDIVPEVLERLGVARLGPPRISIRSTRLSSDTYDLGRWYVLDIPVEDWWAANGQINPDPPEELRLGYLVSRQYNIENATYDLTFLSHKDDGRVSRMRAPAGLVSSSATSATITLSAGHGFEIGEIVDLCSSSGVVAVADLEVTGRTVSSITVDSSVTFTNTQVVRLTSFATYTPTPRRWTYIGDATEFIDGTDAADIYG